MHSRTVVDSNAKEMVKRSIRGYAGYEDWNQRKDSDTRFREHIQGLLDKVDQLFKPPNGPVDNEKLERLARSFHRGILLLKESLDNPNYGAAAFFCGEATQSRIDHIYELERMVLENLHGIAEVGQDLGELSQDEDLLVDSYQRLQALMDNINQALFEREAAFLGDNM